ncbi:PepSY-associated TM helix domain-containing protein [Pseudoalteromonas maricaloris]|uniref:PepSY domain-containing protein n=1 Tax=Pseudoalteromonas maricaloris TaxID=184924 RepID=A0A8I2KPH6_9GAMM|nr:PepSY-associated TM helix domain-containing protein [Pseudoalteromonas maricaloris]NLR20767.1 PepSY domain-containing protein [Pseudoalteromonas maricaloris]WOX29750.1 PepSY-associated TM helix domain-containing protein [Pseudoalteromonas maricaloris]
MAKKISNKFWFQLHGWFSLPIWLLFCFICITGTISVFSHELTWLTNPDSRAHNPSQVSEMSAGSVLRAFKDEHPSADVMGLNVREPYLTYVVMFTDVDKPYALAYVNQYTGAVQEINDGNTFINFMRSLHGWLLFPWQNGYSVGYYLVAFMSLILLGALITGLVVYKKFWLAFFQFKLRKSQGDRTLAADIHKLSGVWSLWFMAVMSLTGLWYLTQAVLWHAGVELEHHETLNAANIPNSTINTNAVETSVDLALAEIQQQYSDFRPSYIMLPEHNRDTLKISGANDYVLYDDYSINIAYNTWNDTVVHHANPDSMTGLQTVMHITDPLHYGTIGGIWTKVIWFIFGCILSGMSVTGFIMYQLRTKRARSQARSNARQLKAQQG